MREEERTFTGYCRRVPSVSRGERAEKTHRAGQRRARCRRPGRDAHASRRVRDARIDRPTARLASGPTVSGPPRGAAPGRRVVVSVLARGALQGEKKGSCISLAQAWPRGERRRRRDHRNARSNGVRYRRPPRLPGRPRPSRSSPRRATLPRGRRRQEGGVGQGVRRGVHQEKRAGGTVDDGWPGLDSACRARPPLRARETSSTFIARARVSSATRASPRRSRPLLGLPATKKRRVRLAYPRSADRSPPPRPPPRRRG